MKTLRACAATVLGLAMFPAASGAATVSVTEETSGPERAVLLFEAAAGEDNIATIAPAGEENGLVRYEVRDLHEPLTAGPGCQGGGGPDVAVTCSMERSRASDCIRSLCTQYARDIIFRFTLGDGDDELRGASIPTDDGGHGRITVEADGGDGDDQLYPGPTDDFLNPGPGADTVRSNQGDDFVDAGDSPDGPDYIDLRDGFDTISYADAAQPVTISLDSQANDGAEGEGDTVADAEELIGTPGPDTITGGDDREELRGLGGGDLLVGNGGPDLLSAAGIRPDAEIGSGPDVLRAGPGNDFVFAYDGDDRIAGGSGDDHVEGMAGADRVAGGGGRDFVDGGKDSDRLIGGSGRDRLEAGEGVGTVRDKAPDWLDCGPSRHDHAFEVEPHDRTKHCERIRTSA